MSYLDNGGKRAVCVWHRRAGKDLVALHQAVKMAHVRKGAYWHCLPTYAQAKKAVWDGFTKDGTRIMDAVFPPEIVKRKNESEMLVELHCGSIVQLVGSDTIDRLVGAGPVHVTFSEYSISKPKAWDLVRPMLRENGGSAAFIYTPRANNHGKELYERAATNPDWFCELLSIHETGALPLSVLDEERAEGMPEALIRQEYLCDFSAALVGSVYGELISDLEKREGLEAFDHRSNGLYTSWDLGIGDAMSIWAWLVEDGDCDVVDHVSASGKPVGYYLDLLEGKAPDGAPVEHKAFAERCFSRRFAKHWLPHDARARSLQTGISTIELMAQRVGHDKVDISPELSLTDGIQAARWLLLQSTRIHPRCKEGLESLRQYHYTWDEDGHILSKKPEHDWSSHDADAFRYLACVFRNAELESRKDKPVADLVKERLSTPYTMDDAWTEMERGRSGGERI